jgi:hypothetical protein
MKKLLIVVLLTIVSSACAMNSIGVQKRDFIYAFCEKETEGVTITTNWGQLWECKDGKWSQKK